MNTQRKTLILITVAFVFILGGLFFAYQFFIGGNGKDDSQGVTTEERKRGTLFPGSGLFGEREGEDTAEGDGFVPKLRQISSAPTADGIVFDSEENTIIRYVERATGHIFETSGSSLEQNRISNTTIPRIQESVWSPNGNEVILRYLDENEILKSFYGKVSGDVGTLEGWFLSNNITNIDVHEDGDIFYIQKIGNNTKGIISNFDGTNSKTVYSSTISGWLPEWMGDSITITTKPSQDISGIMYLLKSNNLEKILSFDGLITRTNPDGSKILFSISNSNETNLFIYDRSNEGFIEMPFRTLAEKCVWASNSKIFCASPYNNIQGIIPDDWYKGALSFSDDIWSYDTETETTRLVFDAAADNVTFDAVSLTVDPEEGILLFTNKNDLTLWALSLK